MKQFTIYSDLHRGHPYEIKPKIKFSKNTVFLGDNFDIKNTSKKELAKIKKERTETIKAIKSTGGIYVSGNHSLKTLKDHRVIRDRILFLHGDIIDYGSKAAKNWRLSKTSGKNEPYRKVLEIYRKIYPRHRKPNKKAIDKAVELAKKNNCHTICMGHFHPKKVIDIKKNKVRIVIIPRGRTKIKL
jgi:UDP-2,3-diacylglucosamine pyrophosphatase LpxH